VDLVLLIATIVATPAVVWACYAAAVFAWLTARKYGLPLLFALLLLWAYIRRDKRGAL
jgi:hypothetical protein